MVPPPTIQALSYIIFVAAKECINIAVTLEDIDNLQHVTHVAEKKLHRLYGDGCGGSIAVRAEVDPS
jgi:hypothetical protein